VTDQRQPPEPDAPAPVEPDGGVQADAGKTVVHQVPSADPASAEPATEVSEPASRVSEVVEGEPVEGEIEPAVLAPPATLEPLAEPEPPAPIAQPTVASGTVPAAPPPDTTPVAEIRPPASAETYAKPSAPAASEWSRPENDTGDGAGPAAGAASRFEERPELAVGAAFAGGFVIAMVLKRLGR
jgi:hypothetical protein